MRSVDHYRAAEALIAKADAIDTGDPMEDRETAMYWASCAQVHATLAVAGAHALNAYSRGDEQELEDWAAAAGGEQ